MRFDSSWAQALSVSACSLTVVIRSSFAGGEREELLRLESTMQDGIPAEASNLRDGGVAPMCKIPQEYSLELFSYVPR